MFKFLGLILILLFSIRVFAFQTATQKISLGPEGYYLKRMRAGGAWQSGGIFGVYGGYERIKTNGFYWGLIGSYAKGRIHGLSSNGRDLVSNFKDKEWQLRFGYTIRDNSKYRDLFTPFIGYGHLEQSNQFLPPSSLLVNFEDSITYFAFGFLSEINISKCFSFGLNVILKWMLEGKCEVSGDPGRSDSTLIMENEWQYALEMPFTYKLSHHKKIFTLSLIPFFQFRHYGGRENYPYDFIDTKFRIYGLRFLGNYWF